MRDDSKRFFAGGLALSAALLGIVLSARAAAPPGRYTVNTDTVVDTATGLTWQRAAASGAYAWDAARSYCAGLSLGGIAAGGWRLPRKLELESIVDFGSYNPAIDPTAFPNTPVNIFWSSSPVVFIGGFAWHVDFNYGSSNYDSMSNNGYSVRCVH
jgi:hypothetical protein